MSKGAHRDGRRLASGHARRALKWLKKYDPSISDACADLDAVIRRHAADRRPAAAVVDAGPEGGTDEP
jgi:hypothetical protein